MGAVPEIVLTGGPCAGKTTALSWLREWLTDNAGVRVFVVPEFPTLVIPWGIRDIGQITAKDDGRYAQIEEQFILGAMDFLSRFRKIAGIFEGKKVIVCDRGPMDAAAYMPSHMFDEIMSQNRLTLRDTRDCFTAVIHLVTAADGAERFYTLENNAARTETPEQARQLDRLTQQAWLGHPHLKVIDNSTDFERKMRRVIQAVCRALGIPVPLEIERKFLLKKSPKLNDVVKFYKVDIEQIYLTDGSRIRKRRAHDGSCVYYRTVKEQTLSALVRKEIETEISFYDYESLSKQRDPFSRVIKKKRRCFIYRGQYFEQDTFIQPADLHGLALVEVELTEEGDAVILPPFLDVARDVTGEKRYSNSYLAKIK